MSKRSIGAVALVLSLVVAACGGAAPAPTASTASPTAAASPTAPPSPSPEPSLDVAPLFMEQIGEMSSGVMTFEAEILAGDLQFMMSGTGRSSGPDSETSTTTTIAGVATTVETIKVAGARYSRTGTGPWLAVSASQSSDLGDELRRAGKAAFEDVGTETRDGREVHRLEPASNSSFDIGALLSTASGVSNIEASLVFFADDEGIPVAAEIEATWTQRAGDVNIDAEMRLVIEFSQIGVRQTIRAPGNVWASYASDRWAYSIAYPNDHEYSRDKDYDYFVGPVEGFIAVSRGPNEGLSASQIAKFETASLKGELGAKSIANDPITLAGLSGRMLTATGSHKVMGGKYLAFEAIVVKGKFVYYVAWFQAQGDQPAKLAAFMQLASTFAFTS